MPFQTFFVRSFNRASIWRDAPANAGIYGLSNAREWIYIGISDDIRGDLLRHLDGDAAVGERQPTGFTFELARPGDRIARQDQLVRELEPYCNRLRRP